jgi:hypothetical protein
MKITYLKPEVREYNIHAVTLLAGSDVKSAASSATEITTGTLDGKEAGSGSVWDDGDEE